MRSASIALLPVAVLLVACGSAPPDSSGTAQLAGSEDSPGAEVTAVEEPDGESTGTESGGPAGPPEIAVQLPGLPIGGGALFFTAAEPTQCAEVNLTGNPVPSGVLVTIESFAVPAGFAIAGGSCAGSGSCLDGHALTPEGGSCSVSLTWNGQPVSDEAELSVAAARAACPDQASCDAALSSIASSGPGALDMDVDGTFDEQAAPQDEDPPSEDLPRGDTPTEPPGEDPVTDPTDGSTG